MPDGLKQPIAFASSTLLPAEKLYSPIEKEELSIIYALSKFHRYLYGRHFTLQTDYTPFITILGSKKTSNIDCKQVVKMGDYSIEL